MVKDTRAPDGAGRILAVNRPQPVTVKTDSGGRPAEVTQGKSRCKATVRSVWRIDDEWWRREPVSRLYYSVLLETGVVMTIFRDLITDKWYKQRYG